VGASCDPNVAILQTVKFSRRHKGVEPCYLGNYLVGQLYCRPAHALICFQHFGLMQQINFALDKYSEMPQPRRVRESPWEKTKILHNLSTRCRLPIFRPYILFSLHKHYSIGPFKKRGHKNVRNIIQKNTTLCRTTDAVDPAKRGIKRARTERAMLDFRPGRERACQLNRAD